MTSQAAVLLAGTHSGCGKTTVTLGIMAALQQRGVEVQPFKCGPDFIDPTLHQMVTGKVSRNLDVRMCGADFVCRTFGRNRSLLGCSVVEGVMGLFDGGEGSAASLARVLDLPVILVVDVRSAAESVAAVVKGFVELDPRVRVSGIIFNRVGSERHQQLIRDAVSVYCDVPILGFLPRSTAVEIPSRHLGLHMGSENPLQGSGLEQLASMVEEHLNLDRLLELGHEHYHVSLGGDWEEDFSVVAEGQEKIPVGVARDEAFCFYYEDNLDLLKAAGADLYFFSPLHDNSLPDGIRGLYLGGGYPELHARALSENESMRNQILAFSREGYPVYGECGGFMYLCRSIEDLENRIYPMTGVYPMRTRMQPRLRRLGYRQPVVVKDSILGLRGTRLQGHEFHYSAVTSEDYNTACAYELDDGAVEGFITDNTLAGYIHLHWGGTPEAAVSFVQACRDR